MNIIPNKERNYLPYDSKTRIYVANAAINLKWSKKKVKTYYHVSRTSVWRWSKKYKDGDVTLESKSHRPLTPHPKTINKDAVYKIQCYKKRNPDCSSIEIWVKTRNSGFDISYSTCLRVLKRTDGYETYKTNPKKKHNKKYYTPDNPGDKWQIDVKYVPSTCNAINLNDKYYQYTYLDEASRKRYLYYTNEHSMYETVKGLEKAISFFGYTPKMIQTDNGFEFSDRASIKRADGKAINRDGPNYLERYCSNHNIVHKFIRPRTPEHNGKVERSHRIDQEKFYRTLKFHSLADLISQGARWNKKYNETIRIALNFKSPNQVELEKLEKLYHDTGEVRCLKLQKRFTSIEN